MSFVMSCEPECFSPRRKPEASSHAAPVSPLANSHKSLDSPGFADDLAEFQERYDERLYSMDAAFCQRLKELERRLTLGFQSKLEVMIAEVARIRCELSSLRTIGNQAPCATLKHQVGEIHQPRTRMDENFTMGQTLIREDTNTSQGTLLAQQHVEPLWKELQSMQEKLLAQETFVREETNSSRLELLKQQSELQSELASQQSEIMNQELALEQARQDLHDQGQDLRHDLDQRASLRTHFEPVNEAIDHINVSLRAFGTIVPADPRVQVFDGRWYRSADDVLMGEISGGVLSWSDDFQRQPCVLIFTGDHAHISMHFDGKLHTGVAETDVTNRMFISWSFGEEWYKRGGRIQHNKSEVKEVSHKVWSAIWRQSLPFREQLEGYPTTYAKRARMCGACVLLLFMSTWFVFGITKMFAPQRFTKIERETRYWNDNIEHLPFLALEWVQQPPHTTVHAELVTITTDTSNLQSESERKRSPISMRLCDFTQQKRSIVGALCLPENLGVVGTFGDKVYQYLRIDVVLATGDAGWANKTQQERHALQRAYGGELALVYRRRDTLYASVIQSQLFSFTLGHDARTIQEIFFDRIKVTNGTIVGLVEVMGMEDELLEDITYTNLNTGYTRFDSLDCEIHSSSSCIVMSFYLRSSLVSSVELYHRHNFMDMMGDAGSLYTSFAACIATILLMIFFCPREVLKCTPWLLKGHARQRHARQRHSMGSDDDAADHS